MDLEQAIFDLYLWQTNPSADHFTVMLYRLLNKADPVNKERIGVGFPTELLAYELWYNSPDPQGFFKQHLGDINGKKEEKRKEDPNDDLVDTILEIVGAKQGR